KTRKTTRRSAAQYASAAISSRSACPWGSKRVRRQAIPSVSAPNFSHETTAIYLPLGDRRHRRVRYRYNVQFSMSSMEANMDKQKVLDALNLDLEHEMAAI